MTVKPLRAHITEYLTVYRGLLIYHTNGVLHSLFPVIDDIVLRLKRVYPYSDVIAISAYFNGYFHAKLHPLSYAEHCIVVGLTVW